MIGEMISAGANLVGGFMNRQSAKEANATNERIAQQNVALQREFAQSGIQWKVADAKAAGIHPLAALGAQTTSFSPVSVGATADNSMGTAFSAAGQDLSRAINATRSSGEKVDAFQKTVQQLTLQKMGLENELLASQVRKTNQAGVTPPLPSITDRYLIPGQSGSGLTPSIKDQPLERVTPHPSSPSQEPGALTDTGYARTQTGLAPVPSKDVKERIEDNLLQETMWAIRNNLMPSVSPFHQNPPKVPVPKGYDAWVYNPLRQEYQPMRFPKWMGRFGRYFAY